MTHHNIFSVRYLGCGIAINYILRAQKQAYGGRSHSRPVYLMGTLCSDGFKASRPTHAYPYDLQGEPTQAYQELVNKIQERRLKFYGEEDYWKLEPLVWE